MNIAVIKDEKIINTIVADTVESAQSLTGLECFEINESNPAGVNWEWNDSVNGYVPPKNYPSWTLNISKRIWQPPVDYPAIEGTTHHWDEDSVSWVED